jgi:hypothetical protein
MSSSEETIHVEKGVSPVQAFIWRTVAVSIAIAFCIASVLPIIYGTMRTRAPIAIEPTVIVDYGNVTCPDFTPQVLALQKQLTASQNEVRALFEQLQDLQSQIISYEVPKCSINEPLAQAVAEYKSQQDLLHNTLSQVEVNLTATTNDMQLILQEQRIKHDIQAERVSNLTTVVSLVASDLQETRLVLEQKEADAVLLRTLDTLSTAVTASLSGLDERLSSMQEMKSAVAELSTSAGNFTCPDPVIPAIVVPEVKVNCPPPPPPALPVICPEPAPVLDIIEEVTQTPARTCVEMAEAKEIVANMVFTELELVTQSLSRHCDESLEATLGACRSAAEDTASSALEEYSAENARLHAEHAEFLATEAEAVAAFRTQALAAKAQCPSPSKQPRKQGTRDTTAKIASAVVQTPVPEPREAFDFALLNAGSRVIAERTSDTYFPAEWNLETQLRSTLHWAGLRDTSVVHSAVELLGVGSGKELYENLNLHKTVGVPEEALTADIHQGSCWPMKVCNRRIGVSDVISGLNIL